MRRLISVLLILTMILTMVLGLNVQANAARRTNWLSAKNASLDWIYANTSPNPLVGSVGGEWAVMTLARAGRVSAEDAFISAYLRDLNTTIRDVNRFKNAGYDIQHPPSAGTFPGTMRRWTDFQRITLALTSLGIDASDYNGFDLTAVFNTFTPVSRRHALNQTINSDIFALIALDSNNYAGTRALFSRSIIDSQRADGSWSIGGTSAPDIDTTAMAVQALAPYYETNPAAAEAVDRAVAWLKSQDFNDPESTAQMIVALTALGGDFADGAEYYVNLLLNWFVPRDGAFRRAAGGPVNMMATEQAAYALVAYYRFVNNMARLYDMTDVSGGVR